MNLDFNKKDNIYSYQAIGKEVFKSDTLHEVVINFIINLENLIREFFENGDLIQQKHMICLSGCIERLKALLSISDQIAKKSRYIMSNLRSKLPQNAKFVIKIPVSSSGMLAHNDEEILFLFETILFHGRALLDRLTFYISKQIYKQDCDTFNKLSKVIEGHSKEGDKRKEKVIKLLNEINPHIEGLLFDKLIDKKNQKSLRSSLMHSQTMGEMTRSTFVLSFLPNKRYFAFDHEIKSNIGPSYPVIGSIWNLSKYLTYLTLNLISVYLENKDVLPLEKCNPLWENPYIHFSQYISNSQTDPKISVIKMTPSGFVIRTSFCKPEILEKLKSFE